MEIKKTDKFNPILIWLLAFFYKLYLLTLRKKIIFSPEVKGYIKSKKPVLIAFWHQDVNILLYISWRFNTLSIVSDSKDGQLVSQIIEKLGSITARGSSRTNPVKAFKGFVRLMKTGKYWACIAVDGPKGPPKKAKSGILQSSRIFSCPIINVNVAYSSKWVLKKSWDQTIIPKPFSKVIFNFSPALETVTKSMDPLNPKLLARLNENMSSNQNLTLGYLK